MDTDKQINCSLHNGVCNTGHVQDNVHAVVRTQLSKSIEMNMAQNGLL